MTDANGLIIAVLGREAKALPLAVPQSSVRREVSVTVEGVKRKRRRKGSRIARLESEFIHMRTHGCDKGEEKKSISDLVRMIGRIEQDTQDARFRQLAQEQPAVPEDELVGSEEEETRDECEKDQSSDDDLYAGRW